VKSQLRNIATLLTAILAAVAEYSQAQNLTLDEIIVTAQLRALSLQQVPVSVSTMAGTRLLESGINNLEGMTPLRAQFQHEPDCHRFQHRHSRH
jgi:iron complex outermembrane receptor protein